MTHDRDSRADAERRRLFRRMEMLYVWGPMATLVLVAVGGGAIVAWLLPLPWPFVTRWIAVVVVAVVAGFAAWLFQRRQDRRTHADDPSER